MYGRSIYNSAKYSGEKKNYPIQHSEPTFLEEGLEIRYEQSNSY